MTDPSKVTKVLIDRIHGGRKQDSKFWKSGFSDETISKPKPIKPQSNNTLKWICGTILIVSLIAGATIIFLPPGLVATVSSYFSNPSTHEKVIIKKVYLPSPNNQTKKSPPIKYSYIVVLKNGKRIDAKSIKKSQGIVHLENNSGLIMKISSSEINSIQKFKI